MFTSSIAWPNLFDPASNRVAVLHDDVSVTNRSKLLILTEPTEIYNEPNQGVGLKRHLWQYNTSNQKAIIFDRIVDQLRLHEPCVLPEETRYTDGLQFTENYNSDMTQDYNELKMTVALRTTFGSNVDIDFNKLQEELFRIGETYGG